LKEKLTKGTFLMPITPWKILESSYLRPGFRLDKCEVINGHIFEPVVFEFSPWANIMAVTKNGEVVLVRQYRHGVQDVLLEFAGGIVDEGEDPLEGARRELLEETGYTSDQIFETGSFYPNPANHTNRLHCYLALDVEKVAEPHLDVTEEIDVHLVPLDELIEMTRRGEFLHALHAAVLFRGLLHLNRIS
jgi:ADP-ribose pyrophosphatase